MRLLTLILLLSSSSQGAGGELERLIPRLLLVNSELTEFNVVSRCAVDANHSVVAVRGTVKPDKIKDNASSPDFFRQELFGVFLVDASWNPLVELDVFASRRWWDYDVQVDKCRADSAVVTRQGATYGDTLDRVSYFYDLGHRVLVSRIPDNPVSIKWIEESSGALYLIGPRMVVKLNAASPGDSEVMRIEGAVEARVESDKLVLLTETQRYELSGAKWRTVPNPDSVLYAYNHVQAPIPDLPTLRLWVPIRWAQRNTVSLEMTGRPPRKFLVWNEELAADSIGGEKRSGIYEITSGRSRFFSLPQPDWETFRKYRPQRVRDGYTRGEELREDVGPFQMVADHLWFGVTFYDGEGTTGVGGIGWFDTSDRTFYVKYLPEIAEWSSSAILADHHEIWLGLVRRPEGTLMPGGLAKVRLSDWTVTIYQVPAVIQTIRKIGDWLYLGTSDGAYRLGKSGMEQIELRLRADGSYRITLEK